MAVTRSPRTIILTAAGDTVAGPLCVAHVKLVGTGMTVGQRVVVKDGTSAAGGVRTDHYIQGVNEDAELFESQEDGDGWFHHGIYLDTAPLAGTWTVTVRLK
jgi:uncharacterized protein YfiM (DUF2279 family)